MKLKRFFYELEALSGKSYFIGEQEVYLFMDFTATRSTFEYNIYLGVYKEGEEDDFFAEPERQPNPMFYSTVYEHWNNKESRELIIEQIKSDMERLAKLEAHVKDTLNNQTI